MRSILAAFVPLALTIAASPALAQGLSGIDRSHPGRVIYETNCAACHDNPGETRAAPFETLVSLSPNRLRSALGEGGVMAPMAAALSTQQIGEVIGYLTSGQAPTDMADNWTEAAACPADERSVNVDGEVYFGQFSGNDASHRAVSARKANLGKRRMGDLEVAWTLGVPEGGRMSPTPVSVGDTIFWNTGKQLVALDQETACVKWSYVGGPSVSPVAFGEVQGKKALVYVTGLADVHAVEAATGELIWKASGQPRNGSGGAVRPGVTLFEDKVIVPISASGVGGGGDYCCTGHGSVVVLNKDDGEWVWEYHTMKEAEDNGQVNSKGQKMRGPSGAPIWAWPSIDVARRQVVVTTGENTSWPATNTSDAIIALDIDSGDVNWIFQAMEADVWNMQCRGTDETSGPNCPWQFDDENSGRDFDFGGAAALVTAKQSGADRDLFLAGQKSGHLWAIDAETGEKVWEQRVGEGGALGGNHWGIATDGKRAFLAISDPSFRPNPKAKPGIYAFEVKSGEPVWAYEAVPDCEDRSPHVRGCAGRHGFSATPLVVGGAVIAGTLDGRLFAFDAKTGEELYQLDTAQEFESVNGIPAKGGAIDSHAIAAGNGMILVGSGYSAFGQTTGNALIALKPQK